MANRRISGFAIKRIVAGVTAFSITALPLALTPAPAAAYRGYRTEICPPIHTLLILPMANQAGPDVDSVSSKIDDAVRLRLTPTTKFTVVPFDRLLPAVQRGLTDNTISEADISTPFVDTPSEQPRAAEMARLAGADAYFVANLEVASVNTSDKTVSLQLAGDVYSTKDGTVIKHIAASVISKALTDTDQVDAVLQYAIDDAATQVSRSIYEIPGDAYLAARRKAQSNGLIAAGVMLAIFGIVAYEQNRAYQDNIHHFPSVPPGFPSPPPGFPALRF